MVKLTKSQIPIHTVTYVQKNLAIVYHLVNVISSTLSKSEHIKWLLCTVVIIKTSRFSGNFFDEAINF